MASIVSLRAGVIGTGFIGPVHVEGLRRLGVSVTAICDVGDLAAKAAARLAIPHAFSDYHDLVACPDVDVVHITTPNRFHCEMSLAALRAGKHVVCEKPLAMNTRETARIVKAAQASGRTFAVNYNLRFYPAILQLRRLVERGEMGEIIHVNGSYMQDWLFKDTDYNWRLLPEEGGKLRAVADIGTHWMDAVSFILGAPITSVFADLNTYHKQRRRPLGEVQTFAKASAKTKYATYDVQTEDFANILLQFDSGARGNVAVSQVAAGRKNSLRIEIYGSKKSAWWCSEEPEQLHFGNRDGANEIGVARDARLRRRRRRVPGLPAGARRGVPGHLQDELPRHLRRRRGRQVGAAAVRHGRGRAPGSGRLRGHRQEPQGARLGEGLGRFPRGPHATRIRHRHPPGTHASTRCSRSPRASASPASRPCAGPWARPSASTPASRTST